MPYRRISSTREREVLSTVHTVICLVYSNCYSSSKWLVIRQRNGIGIKIEIGHCFWQVKVIKFADSALCFGGLIHSQFSPLWWCRKCFVSLYINLPLMKTNYKSKESVFFSFEKRNCENKLEKKPFFYFQQKKTFIASKIKRKTMNNFGELNEMSTRKKQYAWTFNMNWSRLISRLFITAKRSFVVIDPFNRSATTTQLNIWSAD